MYQAGESTSTGGAGVSQRVLSMWAQVKNEPLACGGRGRVLRLSWICALVPSGQHKVRETQHRAGEPLQGAFPASQGSAGYR